MTFEERVKALPAAELKQVTDGRATDLRLTVKGRVFVVSYRTGFPIGREKAFEHLWHSARAAGVLP